MDYRTLGRTGVLVSEICLGTATFGMQADERESFAIMDAARDAGVNFVDTADVYPIGGTPDDIGASEEIVGRWLKGKRDQFVVGTKCTNPTGPGPNDRGSSRRHILAAVEASLRRLQTDYIDLYQIHKVDEDTPIDEVARTLDDLVRAGKVRYVGVSNYPAWRAALMLGIADRHGWVRLVSNQQRYNLLFREIEHEIVPLCQYEGLAILPYNPLAGGLLSGRYTGEEKPDESTRFGLPEWGDLYRRRYWHEANFAAVKRLTEFLKPRARSIVQTAVKWVQTRPGVTSVIIGASTANQVQESLGAINLTLTDEELSFCETLSDNIPRPREYLAVPRGAPGD